MEEVLSIRVPKGTRRRLEKLARAQRLTVSQYVRQALEGDHPVIAGASSFRHLRRGEQYGEFGVGHSP
jgi:predicted DNA-binding protein